MMLLKSFLGGIVRVVWYRLEYGRTGRDYGNSEQQQGDSHVKSSYAVCDINSLQGTSIPFLYQQSLLEGLPSSLVLLHHNSMKCSYI